MITPDDIRALLTALGLTQNALAELLGVSQPTVSRWLKGSTPDPAQEEAIRKLFESQKKSDVRPAKTYRFSYSKLNETLSKKMPFSVNTDAPEILKELFPRDIPIRGIVSCGDGDDASFLLNGETGDYVRRPPGLSGRRSVYALNVYGESMYPVYRHNALVYVDPNQTPAVHEDAVIELQNPEIEDGEPCMAFLKRVKKASAGKILCEQFNPPQEISFERRTIKTFHRVIPWEEVLGY